MAGLPLDLPLKRLIILAIAFGCVEEAVIIAGCLQSRSFLDTRFHQQNMDSYKMKMTWDRGGRSDLLAVLCAFQKWETQKLSVFANKYREERDWCTAHSLNCARINEAAILVDDLRRRVTEQGLYEVYQPTDGGKRRVATSNWAQPVEDVDSRVLLQFVIAGAFYPSYFVTESEQGARVSSHQPPPEASAVFLTVGRDMDFLHLDGVKEFFTHHIGHTPESVERCTESGRVVVTFRKDEYSADPEIPMPVFLALRLRQDKEKADLIIRKVIDPPIVQRSVQQMMLPRSVKVAQAPPKALPKLRPVEFNGPFSELEITTFKPITPDVHYRKVRVAKSSVNYVILNTAKDTRVSRVLVASLVKAGDGAAHPLMIDNTTLLPAEPGFLDLVTVVFAPAVALLPEQHRSGSSRAGTPRPPPKYIRLRAGLGGVDHRRRVWKEHDIDRRLEVDFTPEQVLAMMQLRRMWRYSFTDYMLGDPVWRHKILPRQQSVNRRMLHWFLTQNLVAK